MIIVIMMVLSVIILTNSLIVEEQTIKPVSNPSQETVSPNEIVQTILTHEEVGPRHSDLTWQHYEGQTPKLYFTVNEPGNTFTITNGDAVIIRSGSTSYGYEENNTLRFKACSSSTNSVDYCISSRGLQKRGYSNVTVDIYVPVGARWDLGLTGSHPVTNIKEQTQARKVLKFATYIPLIDEQGFVSMKYVDRHWCYEETGIMEYDDSKPECERIIEILRND